MSETAITLVLMRHGVAETPDLRPTDEDRQLTADGLAAAARAAHGLVALGVRPDVVVSSPLIRCRQTAALVAEAAGCPVSDDNRLAPGMTTDDLLDVVVDHPDADTILVCTHQPGLSYCLAALTGCGMVDFTRAGVAVVRLAAPRVGAGVITAILPPKILRAAAPAR